jgi:hypothetical protein
MLFFERGASKAILLLSAAFASALGLSAASAQADDADFFLLNELRDPLQLSTLNTVRLMAGGRPVGKMWLESGVPADQRKLIQLDRANLKALSIAPQDTDKISLVLELMPVTPDTLLQWLEKRVQVIVSEEFRASDHTSVLSREASYENPGILPVIEAAPAKPTGTRGKVIMANVGVSTYYAAKRNEEIRGIKVPGVGMTAIRSPRSGVIQIGPALFAGSWLADERSPAAAANSISRLSTFFHEARHSDGNGKSIGFFHAVCPEGHVMAGYNSCDRNLNGPYTVGAVVTQGLAESCGDKCTVAQRERLRLRYLDSFGRVLEKQLDGRPTTYWDARPERLRAPKGAR